MSMLAIVTGGAGFIGSHVVDSLLANGNRVVVLDDFSTGKRANLEQHASNDRLTVIEHDVSTGIAAPLESIVAQSGPVSLIVHLAAQVSVVTSIAKPVDDMRVNYGSTLHVLEYARANGAPKIVFASSAAIYGDANDMPVAEETPTRPLSPYGVHKLSSEHAMQAYAATHGVSSVALRFFNVYGPRQDPSSPYSGVISIFADRAKAGRPITIFGDGLQTRDFVYVGDVVRAIRAAATWTGAPFLAANVGTGSEITINDLARAVVEQCGNKSEIGHAAARAGEILKSRAKVERLRDQLGVVAQTHLVEGLAKTLG
jgi:UDP-glucose 4-epimerase